MADEAPYQQSRSALRRLHGSRAIDASAPQSARDFTPSGRARYAGASPDDTPSGRAAFYRQGGKTNNEIAKKEDQSWLGTFPQTPPVQVLQSNPAPARPFATLQARGSQGGALGAIQNAYDTGATMGTFQTPYGTVSFDRRSPDLMPQQAESASDFMDLLGLSGLTGVRPRYRKSVLDSANRWITPV